MEKSFWEKYKTPIVAGVLVLLVVLYIVGMYNSFVTLDQSVNGAWSEVENQYQRQADLIPNLVATLKNYQQFESGTLTRLTELRGQWQSATTVDQKDRIGVEMSGSLGKLIATFEAYPDLKAIGAVNSLMDELAGTQNRIATARGRYIQSIQKFNTGIKRFPANIFASMFGFSEKEYYSAEEGAMKTPDVGGLLG